jgi:glycosyltransferase involved in cell wall biosynthesis
MCTYNGALYLREQLNSIAGQTRLPDRVVIVDDGSSDDTVHIAKQFAADASFAVRVESNEQNLGYAKNFEKAILLSEGDLIVLSDQDDVWHPSKLAKITAAFERSSTLGFAFSDAEVVAADLQPYGYRLWDSIGFSEQKQLQLQAGKGFELLLTWGNVVTGATMAFRSSFRDLVLPIEGGLHDAWIALLISAVAEAVPISDPLIKYRQHTASQIGARKRSFVERVLHPKPLEVQNLERMKSALERLQQRAHAPPDRLTLLEENIDYLAVRLALPRRRVLRLRMICRQLLDGRYHRLSNGVSTAIRDLIA